MGNMVICCADDRKHDAAGGVGISKHHMLEALRTDDINASTAAEFTN